MFNQQLPLLWFLVSRNLAATIRAGLKLMGWDVGAPRLPLLPLEDVDVQNLETLLQQILSSQHMTEINTQRD